MRKLLFFSGFALLFAACSPESDVPGNGNKEPDKFLAVTATIADDTLAFRSGDGIGIFVTKEDGGEYGIIDPNIQAVYDGHGWKSSASMFLSNEPARVCAYYPFVPGAPVKAVPVATDGKSPVLYGVAGYDPGSSDKTAAITMGHALSVVGFNFVKKNYYGAGRLEKVEILNAPGKAVLASRGTLDCTTGIITPIPEDTAKVVKDCKLTKYTDEFSNIRVGLEEFPLIRSIPENVPDKGNTQYLRVLPMAVQGDGDIIYRITIDGVTYTYPVKAGTEWKRGETKVYTFSLEGEQINLDGLFNITWAQPGDRELSINYDVVPFPEEAKPAILQAMKIWAQCLEIKVPITVKVGFAPLNGPAAVASMRSSYIGENRDFRYTDVLLNQLVGYDIDPLYTEMKIVFNSKTWWYYGLDGKHLKEPIDDSSWSVATDLLSITLHEMCHSIGFSATLHAHDGIGTKAVQEPIDMDIFGSFMVDGNGKSLRDYPNNSTELYEALTSGRIAFAGPNAVQANGGKPVLMDNAVLGNYDMSHFKGFNIMASGGYHHPGTIIMAMMQDIGWNIKPLPTLRGID